MAPATTALGYYSLVDPSTEVENSRRLGGAWLMENYDEWRTRTSRDQFEESTDWVHLDYAECIGKC